MNPALNSSVKMDWQTPENVLDLVRQVAPIALDPCTVPENPTGAEIFCAPSIRQSPYEAPGFWHSDDGLRESWHKAGGLVYVNPPYGRELPKWVAKCVDESAKGAEIILLVPARPDTKWFQSAALSFTELAYGEKVSISPAVLFWRGRLKFKGAKDAAPFPSALFYWGPRVGRFKDVFAGRGLFL